MMGHRRTHKLFLSWIFVLVASSSWAQHNGFLGYDYLEQYVEVPEKCSSGGVIRAINKLSERDGDGRRLNAEDYLNLFFLDTLIKERMHQMYLDDSGELRVKGHDRLRYETRLLRATDAFYSLMKSPELHEVMSQLKTKSWAESGSKWGSRVGDDPLTRTAVKIGGKTMSAFIASGIEEPAHRLALFAILYKKTIQEEIEVLEDEVDYRARHYDEQEGQMEKTLKRVNAQSALDRLRLYSMLLDGIVLKAVDEGASLSEFLAKLSDQTAKSAAKAFLKGYLSEKVKMDEDVFNDSFGTIDRALSEAWKSAGGKDKGKEESEAMIHQRLAKELASFGAFNYRRDSRRQGKPAVFADKLRGNFPKEYLCFVARRRYEVFALDLAEQDNRHLTSAKAERFKYRFHPMTYDLLTREQKKVPRQNERKAKALSGFVASFGAPVTTQASWDRLVAVDKRWQSLLGPEPSSPRKDTDYVEPSLMSVFDWATGGDSGN